MIYLMMIFLRYEDVANNHLIDHILHNIIAEIRSQNALLHLLKFYFYLFCSIYVCIITLCFAKYRADSSTLTSKSYVSRLSPEAVDVS